MLPSRGGGCTVVWGPSFSHGRGPPISQSRAAAGIARLSANLSLRRGFTPKELPNISGSDVHVAECSVGHLTHGMGCRAQLAILLSASVAG